MTESERQIMVVAYGFFSFFQRATVRLNL